MDLNKEIQKIQNNIQSKNIELAISQCNKLIQKYPNNSFLHNLGGLALQQFKKIKLSVNYFQKAIDLDPKNLAAKNNLANSLKVLGKLDLAEKLYNDILKINENSLSVKPLTVFGNLPYNISTEILIKWIMNMDYKKSWFNYLVLMFQKEVADRIVSSFNNKTYGRLSIIANWRLNIKKICDISPNSFSPKPQVESSLLLLEPKKNFLNFESPKNLEKITRIFFMHRRKKIKTTFLKLFNKDKHLATKLGIDLI